jgi:hypothetical protein
MSLRLAYSATDPVRRRSAMSYATMLAGALAFAVIALLVFPRLALGQDVVGLDPGSIEQLLAAGAQALTLPGAVRWVVLSLLAVLVGVSLVRRLARGRTGRVWLWIASDEGGTVLKWLASAVTAVVARALAGAPLATWETAAVALGLGAGASLRTDWRRLLRAVAPVVRLIPKIGPPLAALIAAVAGETVKAEIAAKTDAAYRPLSPAPTAGQAADQLGAPPIP